MMTGLLRVRNGHVISAATGVEVVLKAEQTYTGRMVGTNDISFTIRGLTFDGAYAQRLNLEGQEGASLLQIVRGGNVVLENNVFQYAPSFALWIWQGSTQIRGNTFLECFQPIRMDSTTSSTIENNTVTNTAAFKSIQHLDAIYATNLTVRGNTLRGAGLAEPTLHGYEGTWGNSLYIVNCTGFLVELNKVYTNHWSALVSGAGSSNGTVRGNYFTDGVVSSAAMWIEQPGAAYITVDGNELDGGISCGDGGGDNLTITNNTIRSRSVGMDVASGAKTVLIQGNTFISKQPSRYENGIYLFQKNTPDINCQLFNNSFAGFNNGIAINNYGGTGTVYGIHLSGNTFSNNNVDVWIPSNIARVNCSGF